MSALTELRDSLRAAADKGCNSYLIHNEELPPILAELAKHLPVSICGTVSPSGQMVNVVATMRFTVDVNDGNDDWRDEAAHEPAGMTAITAITASQPVLTHALVRNGPDAPHPGWWVTTRKNGEPHSGMPLDHWLNLHGDGYRAADTNEAV